MAQVVLVNPPTSAEERYGVLAKGGSHLPPLGVALLAGIAREAGYDVAIVDAEALHLSPAQAAGAILAHSPALVGFTAVTMTAHSAAQTARIVKERSPETLVVMGGVHATAAPDETLEAFPWLDAVAVGEGDETLPELCAAAMGDRALDSIAGLALRRHDGTITHTPERPVFTALDDLPFPAWDLLPDLASTYRPAAHSYRRLPASSLVTSRGCPGKCTFCDRTVSGHRLRTYSAEYLIRMVETLRDQYGIREIIFHDDNFVASRRRMLEFCRLMVERKVGVIWTCTGRVDMVDAEMLAAMHAAGCWQVSYGVESGSQAILDSLCKGTTLNGIRETLQATHEAGIENRGYFMIGVPGETAETLAATVDFLCELPLDDFHMTIWAPHPGTELTRRVEAERGERLVVDWREMGDWNVVYLPDGLTAQDLQDAQRAAFRRFYLRPRIIAAYAMRISRNPRIAASVLGGFVAWVRYVTQRGRA